MASIHVPSLAALRSSDEGRLSAELRLGRLRSQVAVVRALADQVERFAEQDRLVGLRDQVIEETARLIMRLLEAAGGASPARESADASGVFARAP